MIDKVRNTIEKFNLINDNEKIVVGVSGGPDSISLLNILYELKYDIYVCHINHGLRENANIDEEYVSNFCKERNIPFYVKHINLSDKNSLNGMSTEEAGRIARYDFFNEVAKKVGATKIATAHNSNDNVETVLLNMFRGSGVSGLKGILPMAHNIIRPLIECTRVEIEEYCKLQNLNPRHDESNDSNLYTRNKIRLELIPYLEKNINLNVVSTISRLSSIVQEEESYINDIVQNAFDNVYIPNTDEEKQELIIFNLKKFNDLNIFIRKKLILKAIFMTLGNAKDIEKVHIDDITKMCENNIGGKFLTPNKNIKISINKNKVFFEKL